MTLGGHPGELWKTEADRRGLIQGMVSIPNETRESFCLIDLDQGSVVEGVEDEQNTNPKIKAAIHDRLKIYLLSTDLLMLSGSLPAGPLQPEHFLRPEIDAKMVRALFGKIQIMKLVIH